MVDCRTGCPERQLEPRENPMQAQINRLYWMTEDRNSFVSWLEDHPDYFGQELQAALNAIDARIEEEKDYMTYLRSAI